MSLISTRWERITAHIQSLSPIRPVTILAVTKSVDVMSTVALIQAGAALIGENRVQSARDKFQDPHFRPYRSRVQTHLIGPLQRNKLAKAVELFDCIHAVDRIEILELLNAHLERLQQRRSVYIQINTGNEPQKSGFSFESLAHNHEKIFSFPNITVVGIMAVTPYSENAECSRPYFQKTRALWQHLVPMHPSCTELSMGMSHDYPVAVEEGATLVRLGTILFKD